MLLNPYRFGGGGGGGPTDPLFSSVVLLIQPSGADGSTSFVDQSSYGRTLTPYGNTQVNANRIALDGSGDQLRAAGGAELNFGTQDFCIEFKWRMTTLTGYQVLFSCRPNLSSEDDQLAVYWNPDISKFVLAVKVNGSFTQLVESSGTGNTNTDNDMCVERVGTSLTVYQNGNGIISPTFPGGSPINGATGDVTIGSTGTDIVAVMSGFIWRVRWTIGAYRYGGNHTPPVGPFPTA